MNNLNERYLFTNEKNEYGGCIKIFRDKKKICETFVNYGLNWFDLSQSKNYWFSSLIFNEINFVEKIYSNRTEYIKDNQYISNIIDLKKDIKNINDFINLNLKKICDFVESDESYYHYKTLN
jgi:hypothetical protein